MNLRPHRPEVPEINLTPLIDVVFLLLIFFMVTTSFRDEGRLRLQLPEADVETVPAEEIDLVEVMVDRAGRFYVNAEQVATTDLDTLKQALVGAVGTNRELPVLIKADAKAEHQAVMRVLDAAGQLGLSQVAFAASQHQTTRPIAGQTRNQAVEPLPEQAPSQVRVPDQGAGQTQAEPPGAAQEPER